MRSKPFKNVKFSDCGRGQGSLLSSWERMKAKAIAKPTLVQAQHLPSESSCYSSLRKQAQEPPTMWAEDREGTCHLQIHHFPRGDRDSLALHHAR